MRTKCLTGLKKGVEISKIDDLGGGKLTELQCTLKNKDRIFFETKKNMANKANWRTGKILLYWETDYRKTNNNATTFCRRPLLIEAREVGTYIPASKTGDVLKRFNVYHGLICDNRDQISGRCHDYEVRYLCSSSV